MSEKLFAEFPAVTTEQWEEVITKDLKGADYDKKLVWKTIEGFNVRPYYRAENLADIKFRDTLPGQFPFVRGTKKSNEWLIRQDFCACENLEEANRLALDALMKGANSIGFELPHRALDEKEMAVLLKDICLQAIEVNFCGCCPGKTRGTLDSFLKYAEAQGVAKDEIRASFDFSPLHALTVKGRFCDDAFDKLADCVKAVAAYPGIRVVAVKACDFNSAGSSISQELGYAMAIGSEYMTALTDRGLDAAEVARRIKFIFAISGNYFFEIAKFRAARVLWANIVKAYGVEDLDAMKIKVHAVTSSWNQTVYDAYVNMLRGTTEAMSAALAGVDSIVVLPFDHAFRAPNEFSNRIARNTQSILKEEAHFDKVEDPGAGSYYIETLTSSIAKAAWDIFKSVDEKGGYVEAFKAGDVQAAVKAVSDKRDQAIAKRRDTILGTNQYPNFLEKASDEITKEIVTRDASCGCCCGKDDDKKVAEPLRPYRGAQAFEALRLATDRSGKQPQAFMLTFGNLAMCRARAQFSCNFFAVAGFKVVDNNRFSSVEEGVEAALAAKADIVVACSADDEYAEAVPKIKELIGDKAIVVVAGDPECRPELEAKGIDKYIHVRCNVLETLKEYQAEMGIKEL
ncbi:MAG: methylmalonyl-CoA mutase small subunit [Bacteroidales bacterium]|nr:methylmalonyl-CoA mutase small subunit [Bacteroidales bacterium]MBP5316863.1 methylmalonyl-CoA mutase small subunit [Bacteroidales bacterium]